jgi:hypothetical protein
MSNNNVESTCIAVGQATLSQADFARGQSRLFPASHSAESPSAVPNLSTGPRTEAGKAASSRNAVKHNLCSKRLTGSDLEEFNAIRARLEDEWESQTETECLLLDQMALGQWRMDRALSLEMNAFDEEHVDQQLLALALRYRTTAERSFYKALAELQRLRSNMRKDTLRQQKIDEQDREAAATAALDRLCFAPVAGVPRFVSQNLPAPPPQSDPDALNRSRNGQIGV